MPRSQEPILEPLVVECFYRRQLLTASELQSELKHRGRKCTIQGVYYELRKLCHKQIVVKVGQSYLLRLPWLTEEASKITSALRDYRSTLNSSQLLEAFEMPTMLKVASLQDLHTLWASIGNALIKRDPGQGYFEWCPYAWFQFSIAEVEEEVLSVHARTATPYHLVLAEDCFLNREYLRIRSGIPGKSCFGKMPSSSLKRVYLSIYGEYTIKISLDDRLSKRLEEFFRTCKKLTRASLKEAGQIVSQPTSITMQLAKMPKKAELLRRSLREILHL